MAAIDNLMENPCPKGVRKLVGQKNRWRLRVGDYRILYTIDDDEGLITIYRIGHRKEVYRNW